MESPKNPFESYFESRKNIEARSGNIENVKKKIECLVESEDFEEARALLKLHFPDPGNIYRVTLTKKMDSVIQECDPDRESYLEWSNSSQFDGTDVRPFLELDKKLLSGTASKDEIFTLYYFWSAYPSHKPLEYCFEMFEWLLLNNQDSCSDLTQHLMERMNSADAKYFYFLLAKGRGWLQEVRHVVDYFESETDPMAKYSATLEYWGYKATGMIPEKYHLKNCCRDA